MHRVADLLILLGDFLLLLLSDTRFLFCLLFLRVFRHYIPQCLNQSIGVRLAATEGHGVLLMNETNTRRTFL